LGERLEGLPVVGSVQGNEGLGDGVLFDIEGQPGDPLDEALLAAVGKAIGKGQEDVLPQRPQLRSLHRAPPGVELSAVSSDNFSPGGVLVNLMPARCAALALPFRFREKLLSKSKRLILDSAGGPYPVSSEPDRRSGRGGGLR